MRYALAEQTLDALPPVGLNVDRTILPGPFRQVAPFLGWPSVQVAAQVPSQELADE